MKDVKESINKIVDARKQDLQQDIKRYPANNFRASDIPDCDRYLCYSILDWQKKELFNEHTIARLRKGNEEEKHVKAELMKLGFEITLSQSPIEIKNRLGEVICRGHIDGKINIDGNIYPLEIKSSNPNIFNQINSYDDLDKKVWLRKYKRQMQMYMFGNNEEQGIILFTDCLGHWKLLPAYLDLGECEWILQRLERCWDLVKKKEYSDRIDLFSDACDFCSFKHFCLPDIINKPPEMIENKVLEQALDRRKELHPYHLEYNSLDKKLKSKFRETEKIIVGTSWEILTLKKMEKKLNAKLLPPEIKERYSEEKEKVTIKFLEIGTRDIKQAPVKENTDKKSVDNRKVNKSETILKEKVSGKLEELKKQIKKEAKHGRAKGSKRKGVRARE